MNSNTLTLENQSVNTNKTGPEALPEDATGRAPEDWLKSMQSEATASYRELVLGIAEGSQPLPEEVKSVIGAAGNRSISFSQTSRW